MYQRDIDLIYTEMDEILLKYGLPGVCILGLALFVLKLMGDHRKERDEWREENRRQQEDSTKVIRDTGNILSGLKTLLENQNRK